MIAKLIAWCVHNRVLVLLLTGFLVVAGLWSARSITVDAIPDLSDVQVVIRTEYPGQAPEIVEDQVTFPLTTIMLAVPYAKVVRGYSMFGASFVYIIFEDGTDMYWARSRVLEQLSVVSSRLPAGVTPQLGPDATGVGWIYEYVLTTGPYCPDHPDGAWHDPVSDRWYASFEEVPEAARKGATHHRVFPPARVNDFDPVTSRRYDDPAAAPADTRSRLEEVVLKRGFETCPLDGKPLHQPDQDLSELRSLQDWYLRYELTALDGVSEVAAVGGFVKQYQVVVDPVKLQALKVPLARVEMAIRRSNLDVGGSVIEMGEAEYMVRGRGYLGHPDADQQGPIAAGQESRARSQRVLQQLEGIALDATDKGVPIRLGDVASVRLGPDMRRGLVEWNGEGEVVASIVVMRFGENARDAIGRVKDRLRELEHGLPPGVAVLTAYDRSDLIDRSVQTLTRTLFEEITVVALIIILFLLHARSALVAAFVLPTGVLLSLTAMYLLGMNANIMSLGGIAIAIGVMVDSSIIMVENAHKHLEWEVERVAAGQTARTRVAVIIEAASEVGPSLFFALLILTVGFIPVFALGEQSGRLFKPLAYTKTFSMGAAALLAITVIPSLMYYFISEHLLPDGWSRLRRWGTTAIVVLAPALVLLLAPLPELPIARSWLALAWVVLSLLAILPQRILGEHQNPVARALQWLYAPAFRLVMRHRRITLGLAVALLLSTLWPLSQLGSEFMPPLEEGDLLYMPTTDPGISVTKARELLQQTDKLILQFPEVASVLGKAGRADTATDPAPMSMLETTIVLHRDKSHWRQRTVDRFYSTWPRWLSWLPRLVLSDTRPINGDDLVYGYELPGGVHVPGLNETVSMPGLTNAWTMPIRTRIDMLSTGIRTPVGIKVLGDDLTSLTEIGEHIAQVLKTDSATGAHTLSAFAEKSMSGRYFDVQVRRDEIARYGLQVADVQAVIMSALGGMNVAQTIEGRERYPINIRYPHELRDNRTALQQILVATPSGTQVPLGQLATFTTRTGADMIKSENARLTSWVYVDIAGIDIGSYVENARRVISREVPLPAGTSIVWSGQYEYMAAANRRLAVVIPLAVVLIVLLLYLATHSWLRTSIVLLAVPFSLIGAFWLLYALDYNLSLAVWVGIIALAGLDAETGLVMLLYLENSHDKFAADGRMRDDEDLMAAVHDGAVQRIRPKTMTVMTTFIGLVPLLFAAGAGADTMRRLAAPMIGGLASSFLLELLIYPVLFFVIKRVTTHLGASHGAPGDVV